MPELEMMPMQGKTADLAPRYAVLTTLHGSDAPDLWRLAVDSVLSQETDGRIDLYVCVDGPISAEQSALLSDYEAQIHTLLRNTGCLGLAASLNRLIDALDDAEFVFRMDGDDISLPGRFQAQIDALRARADVDLVGCQAWDISEDGTRVGTRDYPVDPQTARRLLVRQNPVLHPTYCLRRQVFEDPANRYPNAHLTEDLAFLIILAERGVQFASIPERLFEWRVGQNFLRRRASLRRGLTEFFWFTRAARAIHGPVTWRYVYGFARLVLRCLPPALAGYIYRFRAALKN